MKGGWVDGWADQCMDGKYMYGWWVCEQTGVWVGVCVWCMRAVG